MKNKALIFCGIPALILAVMAVYYTFSRSWAWEAESGGGRTNHDPPAAVKQSAGHPVKNVSLPGASEKPGDAAPEDLKTVEGIKQQLYHLNIEYTEDLDLLDDMVQPSAGDPPALWRGNWVSDDDWKRYDDTFRIEKDGSGRYRFIPEGDGPKSYTYDKDKKEFVWEMNYYGKIITSHARFITDDVMVLTKISGDKAALDIYRRDRSGMAEKP